MNRSSAEQEVRAALTPKPKIPDYDFLTMSTGSVVLINGVPCWLHFINRGKRRLTFTPVSPVQVMPVAETANPVLKVKK